ncbi:MAG: DUF6577 family protein, partial [Nitrososphaerales archaeon]
GIYRIPAGKHITLVINESMAISDEIDVILASGSIKKAMTVLARFEYMITGASALMRYHHYIPRRMLHLVYVIKGSGEYVTSSLTDAGLRALLEPTRDQLMLALDNFKETELFLIREFTALEGNNRGIAIPEKAILDLYFETTRRYILFPEEEVGRIFEALLKDRRMNLTKLFWLAERRGIRGEIIAIVKYFFSDMIVENADYNSFVERVLHAVKYSER